MNNILIKLHTFIWYPLTILTGMLAGFMVSHSIMLGRFFNWYITSGNEDLLRETFTVFRAQSNAKAMYDIPLYVAFILGIIWTIVSFVIKKDRIIALIAGLSTLWVGMIFMISDLDEAEEAVLSSAGNADLTQLFLNINIPTHMAFAVIYLVSFTLLLWNGMRAKKLRENNDYE